MTKQLLERALELTKDVLDSLEDWAGYAPTYFKEKHGYDEDLASYDQRIKDLEAAIASWSDEPVGVMIKGGDGLVCHFSPDCEPYDGMQIYTRPAPKQVPMSDEELATLKHRAALYEHIRKFNPVKFNEFYSRNIKGGGAFDDLVYQDLVKEQSL